MHCLMLCRTLCARHTRSAICACDMQVFRTKKPWIGEAGGKSLHRTPAPSPLQPSRAVCACDMQVLWTNKPRIGKAGSKSLHCTPSLHFTAPACRSSEKPHQVRLGVKCPTCGGDEKADQMHTTGRNVPKLWRQTEHLPSQSRAACTTCCSILLEQAGCRPRRLCVQRGGRTARPAPPPINLPGTLAA